jgi:hypothetical protein
VKPYLWSPLPDGDAQEPEEPVLRADDEAPSTPAIAELARQGDRRVDPGRTPAPAAPDGHDRLLSAARRARPARPLNGAPRQRGEAMARGIISTPQPEATETGTR